VSKASPVSNVSDVTATGCEGTNHYETLVVERNEETESNHLYQKLPHIYENIIKKQDVVLYEMI